jgi:thiol-disulfide isomerase/thioredoxin
MRGICLLMLGWCSLCFANAQTSPAGILQKTINKIHSLKTVSYEERFISKNPFSKGDTALGKTKSTLIFDDHGLISAMHENTVYDNGLTKYTAIFRNDTLYSLDLRDSIFSFDKITDQSKIYADLNSFTDDLKDYTKKPSKIIQKKDTIISNTSCYSFFIRSYDTIDNGKHNYTYNYLFINKATLMPVYIKETGEATAEKGGYDLGRVTLFNEKYYSNFRFNEKIDRKLFHFNRSDFDTKNNKMLSEGTVPPDLKLKDLNGQDIAPTAFKNKLLLIEFGATDCGANPLANPVLNRLKQKYSPTTVSIISIYSNETANQVKKYISSNGLEFPAYLSTRKLVKAFKTVGTPNFYLIGKNGKILKSFEGFNGDLEKNLTAEINKAIEQ